MNARTKGRGFDPQSSAAVRAARAVISVGDGRGFIVMRGDEPLIVTAAHCLPKLPDADSMAGWEEHNFHNLLGPLNAEPTVMAKCRFIDPISDLAVLAGPDNQTFHKASVVFEGLIDDAIGNKEKGLAIGRSIQQGQAWLLSLAGHWFPCQAAHYGGPWWLSECAEVVEAGMSGSPILDDLGRAIGVVCSGHALCGEPTRESGGNPRLDWHLPAGLFAVMTGKGEKWQETRGF